MNHETAILLVVLAALLFTAGYSAGTFQLSEIKAELADATELAELGELMFYQMEVAYYECLDCARFDYCTEAVVGVPDWFSEAYPNYVPKEVTAK